MDAEPNDEADGTCEDDEKCGDDPAEAPRLVAGRFWCDGLCRRSGWSSY
jgi:hypothetical protein